jgi:MSHA pilin protein MshA
MKRQTGFTLLELVVVIVVLGILSAVAVPNFVDLSTEAGAAGAKGVAGGITSASAINVAACKAGNVVGCIPADTFADCPTGAGLLLLGGVPSGYSVTDVVVTGDIWTCTVTEDTSGETATARIHTDL